MEIFRLQLEHDGDPIVRVAGELDISAAPALRRCFHDLDGENVTVDFSAVTFMDSSVLGVLLAARERAFVSGAGFVVRNVPDIPLRVFELTGVAELFGLGGQVA